MSDVAAAVARRTDDVVRALRDLDDESLNRPSLLPEWSRLTIACHLRYGAAALALVTTEALAGRPASYYPQGREAQRPGTLVPEPGESPGAVIDSLGQLSRALDEAWSALDDPAWQIDAVEPPDLPDLGTRSVRELAVGRLTEVEVHGTDLDIGLSDWSGEFVRAALPLRMQRLRTRPVRSPLSASWHFDVYDGPSYLVTVDGSAVDVREGGRERDASVTWKITSRDLLAMLLGRPMVGAPQFATSQPALLEAFGRAFPGP